MAERIPANLSKIIEDPDGEANTSVAAKSNGAYKFSTNGTGDKDVTSNRSSVVYRVNAGGNNAYDNEYNGTMGGDMSKKNSGNITRQSTKDFQ